MSLPRDHPQRIELNDEVHARPPEALVAPARLSYLALLSSASGSDADYQSICDLARQFGAIPPELSVNHYSTDLGPFRVKWERHSEFVRYTFIAAGAYGGAAFAKPAIDGVPVDWVASLAGELIVATHVALMRGDAAVPDAEAISTRYFEGNTLAGAAVAESAGTAFTDFRVRADGFSRFYVEDRGLTPRQAGRIIQRLLEIDTYRIMALLALPVARELAPFLNARERDLVETTTSMVSAGEADEPMLLDRLTRLEAAIDSRLSENHYRFSAAAAYSELVQRRIEELREVRIPGLQTFREFTDRRLAPAMSTCRTISARQEQLSMRVARATQLLSTRVDITHERQNQKLLESMDRRASLQLRLQETVEGLSVAAVTYYVVGLVGYAAKGLKAAGAALNPDLVMGVSIPIVLLLTGLGVRKIRQTVSPKKPDKSHE